MASSPFSHSLACESSILILPGFLIPKQTMPRAFLSLEDGKGQHLPTGHMGNRLCNVEARSVHAQEAVSPRVAGE